MNGWAEKLQAKEAVSYPFNSFTLKSTKISLPEMRKFMLNQEKAIAFGIA